MTLLINYNHRIFFLYNPIQAFIHMKGNSEQVTSEKLKNNLTRTFFYDLGVCHQSICSRHFLACHK